MNRNLRRGGGDKKTILNYEQYIAWEDDEMDIESEKEKCYIEYEVAKILNNLSARANFEFYSENLEIQKILDKLTTRAEIENYLES